MKSMMWVLMAVVAVAFVFPVMAEEGVAPAVEKPAKPKAMKQAPPMEEMTLTGKVSKNEMGKFILTQADGSMCVLPVKKGVEGAPDVEKFVGKEVTIVGKGHVQTKKSPTGEEIKKTYLGVITSISEAAAAAPAEPAAPAAPVAPAVPPVPAPVK